MRKLATLQQIDKILPVENADRLEIVIVKGWNIIVQKGLYTTGDWAVFHEIDSAFRVNQEPYHSDLKERGTKKCQLETGEIIDTYVIRSLKLRGVVSQGYLVPLHSYTKEQQKFLNNHLKSDYDVTKFLNVLKFEKPETGYERDQRVKRKPKNKFQLFLFKTHKWLQKKFPNIFTSHNSEFPDFIKKTDCVRVQNCKELVWDKYVNNVPFQISYKLDGSSISVWNRNNKVGVCSRSINKNLKEITDRFVHNGNIIHNTIGEKNKYTNLCLQGELISPKIQNNFEGVSEEQVHIFSIWDIENQQYWNPQKVIDFCNANNIKHVPILEQNITLQQLFPNLTNSDELLEALLKYADGPSGIKGKYREGIVLKELVDGTSSIKVISNKYLLKNQD